jgi:predicted ferric reductase
MTRTASRATRSVFWGVAYAAIALAPFPLALVGSDAGRRGFWVELGVGLGFAGLAMLGLQFALTARFSWIGRGFGLDDMMQVHRQAGLIGGTFVLAHPAVLIAAEPAYLSFFDPRVNLLRALALAGAVGAVVMLLVLPLARRRLRLPYEWWRLSHALFASLAVFIGVTHVMMVGHYVSEPWRRAIWIAMSGGALLLLAHTRLVRPRLLRRRRWAVTEVRPERERVWTVVLAAEGHGGMRFSPGQFAWVTFGDSPLSLQQHPFTIASSAERPDRLELTIKELGDFTSTVASLSPGTRAYLDGPHGAFTLDEHDDAAAAVLIAGGIGITPAVSLLRTLRDRGDRRPLTLIYGNATLSRAVFRDELEALRSELALEVVHVLEEPPADWQGETGFVTGELLERQLDLAAPGVHYFVCGPDVMMDGVERALRAAGVPPHRVHAERFNMM